MICEDEKRAVRDIIMHIDICLPVVILPAPISVCCYDSPIRPAGLSHTVIPRNYFETGDGSRDDVSRGWINTTYMYLRNIYKIYEV